MTGIWLILIRVDEVSLYGKMSMLIVHIILITMQIMYSYFMILMFIFLYMHVNNFNYVLILCYHDTHCISLGEILNFSFLCESVWINCF